MQVVKPRCVAKKDSSGKEVGWLVHGSGVKVYGFKSIDHALGRWVDMIMNRTLKRNTETV